MFKYLSTSLRSDVNNEINKLLIITNKLFIALNTGTKCNNGVITDKAQITETGSAKIILNLIVLAESQNPVCY